VRPQAMARLGLSWEDVRAVNPRLLYVGTYGYSQNGPYAAKAAYDDLIQGASGVPWVVSRTGAEPNYAPVNFADRVTGLHAVYTVTAALFQRERTGVGQSIEVPMFESISHFVLGDHLAGLSWMDPVGGAGYQRLIARRPYKTSDGYLCVLVYNDKQWRGFLDAIGQPERMRDPRFATQANRAANIHDIYVYLGELFRTRTTVQWLELLEKADIPVSRMNSIEDVVNDPHLNESGFFYAEDHPSEGRLRAMRTPTHWQDSEPDVPSPAPRLGEHSAEILRELGYSDAEIAAMAKSGVTIIP
jgi:crotonobetainyl-CoA:carnitine CoA-transferase CaiB-like acyl-CoA transferase